MATQNTNRDTETGANGTDDDGSVPFDSEGMLREHAVALHGALGDLDQFEPETRIKVLARTSSAAALIHAQLRQHTKSLERAVTEIPIEMIVAHLQTLDLDRRRHICREVLGEENDGPVIQWP